MSANLFLYFYHWLCWHHKNYSHPNFFPYFYHLHRWHWKNYSNPNFFFVFFAIDTVDIWINLNMSKKNIKSTVRWLSDAAVDIVNNKKLIHQPIFFPLFGWWLHWCLWHLKKLQRSIELKHILSFLLIHTVQILIWMFSALR